MPAIEPKLQHPSDPELSKPAHGQVWLTLGGKCGVHVRKPSQDRLECRFYRPSRNPFAEEKLVEGPWKPLPKVGDFATTPGARYAAKILSQCATVDTHGISPESSAWMLGAHLRVLQKTGLQVPSANLPVLDPALTQAVAFSHTAVAVEQCFGKSDLSNFLPSLGCLVGNASTEQVHMATLGLHLGALVITPKVAQHLPVGRGVEVAINFVTQFPEKGVTQALGEGVGAVDGATELSVMLTHLGEKKPFHVIPLLQGNVRDVA